MLHIVHHITCTTPFSGLLVYFSDGMLPLLKSFYADFFNPTGGGSDRRRWMRVSSDILTALLVSFFYCSCMTSCLWGRCTLSQARVLAPWERIKCILTWHDVLISYVSTLLLQYTNTQHLCDSLAQYFTTDSQVKLYRTTVLTIMHSGHGEIQVEDQVCLHWGGSSNLKLNALCLLRYYEHSMTGDSTAMALWLQHDKPTTSITQLKLN